MTQKRKIIIYIVVGMAIFLLVWFTYHFRNKLEQIIAPFLIALTVAYLINPIIIRMEKKKISRTLGILSVYLLFSLFIIAIVIFIIPEVANNTKDLMNTLPEIMSRYQGMVDKLMSLIQASNWPDDVKNTITGELQNGIKAIQSFLMAGMKKSVITLAESLTGALDLILAMIIAYYFVKDVEFFKKSVLLLTPKRWRNGIVSTGQDINLILSNFIQGQLLTALIVGTMEVIGLMIVKVKYPVVLGLIGGIANVIPYFGPFIGAIPAVAIALIDSPAKAMWTALIFIIVQQIDNAFISPKIIEGRLGLHPVTTILAVLVGGEFFGIMGMLVAVPITAIIKVIMKRSIEAIV